MPLRIAAFAVVLFLGISAARAEIVELNVPDSTERLLVALPDGWKEAHNKTAGNQTIIEYIPEGQSLDRWDDMITVTILRTPMPPSAGFSQSYSKLLITTFERSFCKSRFDPPSIINGPRNNFPSSVYKFDCFTKPEARTVAPGVHVRNFEMLGGIVIEGRYGIYQVQRAWHSDEFALNEKGEFAVPMRVADQVLAARDAIHDFGVASTTPCDTAAADRPCSAPPITQQ